MDVDWVIASLNSLPPPVDEGAISVRPLIGNAFLGISGGGLPSLFLRLSNLDVSGSHRRTRALEIIVAEDFVTRSEAGGRRVEAGYLMRLVDPSKRWCFAVLVAQIAATIKKQSRSFERASSIEEHVSNWNEFFEYDVLRPEAELGLWGELYLITRFQRVERGVATWVGASGEPCDFMGSGVSVELKTSLRSTTAWFSVQQIDQRRDGFVVVLQVLRDRLGGVSLDELVGQISAKLPENQIFVAELAKVGYAPGTGSGARFSVEKSFAVPIGLIPRPTWQDERIRRVRYQLDMESLVADAMPIDPVIGLLEWGAKGKVSRKRAIEKHAGLRTTRRALESKGAL